MIPDPRAASDGLRAHVGPLAWRVAAGALVATGRASPAAIGIAGLVAAPALFEPPILLRLLIGASLLPGLVGWLLQRAFAAEVAVRDGVLQLRRRDLEVDVPGGSIAYVAPWWLPLPGPGFSLALRSGARLRERVQAADPTPILFALAAHGIEPARTALRHPALAFAHAREAARGGWWRHPLAKFVLFALAPAAVLFNLHQHVAYGAALGQYYLEGPWPWLKTFAFYWSYTALQLLLYASVWRAIGEAAAWMAAVVAPARAARVRRSVEVACLALFYAGVPALLTWRFLQ